MNRERFSALRHRHLALCNPIRSDRMDELLALAALSGDSRALDFGCGKGEVAIRLARRFGCRVDAVDRSAPMIEEGHARAAARGVGHLVTFHCCDAATFEDRGPYALTVAIGATHAAGSYEGLLRHLAARTRDGGLLLVGETYWKRTPSPEFLAALGVKEEDLRPHAENVRIARQEGLVALHAITASEAEWDAYEWALTRSLEEWAAEHPDDPEVTTALERSRSWSELYLSGGRETLGFGLYLFRRP